MQYVEYDGDTFKRVWKSLKVYIETLRKLGDNDFSVWGIPYHTIPYRGKGAGEGGDLGLDTGNGVIMNGKKR